MGNLTDELRARLDELGVEHKDNDCNFYRTTQWDCGGVTAKFQEWRSGNRTLDAKNVTPAQAIAATVGDKPKDNPRNYNHDGTPKIPNMNVGADPDWVDWVASLEHKEPLDLTEAVKQLMFEVICFGGEMGPNDCGGEYCPDEGMVYTDDFIDGWVRRIAATVGAGTCHMEVKDNLSETEGMGEVWLECDKCHWQMPLEPTTPRFKYCPNCRAEIKED